MKYFSVPVHIVIAAKDEENAIAAALDLAESSGIELEEHDDKLIDTADVECIS